MSRTFATTNDEITFASNSAIQPAAITISVWFNGNSAALTNAATLLGLFESSNTLGIYFIGPSSLTAGRMSYYFAGSASFIDPGSQALSANTWYNIVATYNSSVGLAAYINGVSDGTAAQQGALTTSTKATQLGTLFGTSLIADLAIWNLVLSAAEIAALAAGARPYTIRRGSLGGYWPLDGLQSPEPDLSGNAINGTIVSGTSLGFGPPVMPFTPRWPIAQPIPPAISSFALPPIGFGGSPNMVRRTNVIMA